MVAGIKGEVSGYEEERKSKFLASLKKLTEGCRELVEQGEDPVVREWINQEFKRAGIPQLVGALTVLNIVRRSVEEAIERRMYGEG